MPEGQILPQTRLLKPITRRNNTKAHLAETGWAYYLSEVNHFFAVKLCNSPRIRSMTFPFTRPNVLTTMDLEIV